MTTVLHGDCLEVMASLAMLGVRVDSVVTDPPYHLTTAGRFGAEGAAPAGYGTDGLYQRASRGFMGKEWDGGDVAFRVETWRAAYDLLKPGGHLIAFSGSRTYHRMVCAIEDAGFEIRDRIRYECSAQTKYGAFVDSLNDEQRGALLEMLNDATGGSELAWLYGTGFPKSRDISKDIDKRAHAGWIERGRMRAGNGNEGWQSPWMDDPAQVDKNARQYLPATPDARRWEGWGTALKPAHEPIVMARKPLIGTVAENVTTHGTGAINIDACRVGADVTVTRRNGNSGGEKFGRDERVGSWENPPGRFPANVIHDGSDEVLEAFAAYGERPGQIAAASTNPDTRKNQNVYGEMRRGSNGSAPRGDGGSAARFFYSAKASAKDRNGSKHPTVKPVALISYLATLVTPPGGVCLDPFAGSGTLGAAWPNSILIEREAEYIADIQRRLSVA